MNSLQPAVDLGFECKEVEGYILEVIVKNEDLQTDKGQPLSEAILATGKKKFFLDFTALNNLTSNGVTQLLLLQQGLRRIGGTFIIYQPGRAVLDRLALVDIKFPTIKNHKLGLQMLIFYPG